LSNFVEKGQANLFVMITEKTETTSLNSLQISLLRLFDQKLDKTYTLELRQLMMDFFDQKLQAELNEVTTQKGYTDDDYRKMLHDDTFAIE